jgi:aminomethyltransferase
MISTLRRTPLFQEHLASGARMVDFSGWEMPVHYGSQLQEHQRMRSDAGMFDVSHMLVLDLEGEQAHDFLRRVLANDVARLEQDGRALYSCLLREDGGILDDLIVYRRAAARYRAVLNAGRAETDMAWLNAQAREKALRLLPRRDLAIIALQGPAARERLWQVRPAWRQDGEQLGAFRATGFDAVFVARTGYTGEDGLEIMVPGHEALGLWRDLLAAGVQPCGLGARDTLRLEAGMALYGQDLDEDTTPAEAGLGWTVSLHDEARAFIGRAALGARQPRFQTVGLVLLDKGVLRSHQHLRCSAGAGIVTSGGFAPTLERSIALARLPLSCRQGDDVEVAIRDKWLHARVVNYPFVRHGKSLLPALP